MPELNRTTLTRGVIACIVAVTLAAGLFFTVRALDTPSDEEMSRIEGTIEDFFATYDAVWPAEHYGDSELHPEVRSAMRTEKQRVLRETVTGELLAAEMANDRVIALEELRNTEGLVITEAGHELVEVDYLRTAMDHTAIVRVKLVDWRQEGLWDAATAKLLPGSRTERTGVYDVSLRTTDEGWRIVGLRPVTEE